MNVELAKKVREMIRQHPERHDQCMWSSHWDLNPAKHCGTAACIAGWVAAVKGKTLNELGKQGIDVVDFAVEALEITHDQGNVMFYTTDNDPALLMFDKLIETEGAATEQDLCDAAWGEGEPE